MNRSLRILSTGGTFEKRYDELSGSLIFDQSIAPDILRTGRCDSKLVCETVMLIDSLEMTDAHRERLADRCKAAEESALVIIHGTDTMTETALFLKRIGLEKTIVLTGAMIPKRIEQSDATFNLAYAMACAQTLDHGVWIAMNGRVFAAGHVQKDRKIGRFIDLPSVGQALAALLLGLGIVCTKPVDAHAQGAGSSAEAISPATTPPSATQPSVGSPQSISPGINSTAQTRPAAYRQMYRPPDEPFPITLEKVLIAGRCRDCATILSIEQPARRWTPPATSNVESGDGARPLVRQGYQSSAHITNRRDSPLAWQNRREVDVILKLPDGNVRKIRAYLADLKPGDRISMDFLPARLLMPVSTPTVVDSEPMTRPETSETPSERPRQNSSPNGIR